MKRTWHAERTTEVRSTNKILALVVDEMIIIK